MTVSKNELRIFSFGGGRQSMAALVLASQGKIDYNWFVFCDVGEDSENPDTIEYVNEVAIPFAKQHGIKLEIIHKKDRYGERKTIYQTLYSDRKTIFIPMYMGGGRPGNRSCTVDFKIRPFQLYAFQNKNKADGVVVGLGITVDEIQRARTTEKEMIRSKFYVQRNYPLLDLKLSLNDCVSVVSNAGLPVPPKSSCYFCPFHTTAGWINLKREHPKLFQKSVEIELHLNKTRKDILNSEVYLHRSLKPLDQVISNQSSFFDDDFCESGFCMT